MNLNRFFSLVEGQSPSTIGFKNIPAPAVGAALISGGASLLGGIGSFFSKKDSNKQNAIENQKDRDFQHNEAELAYLRQKGLIDSQNQYNSFSNQRRLAEQAGLNPYRLFDQGSSGIATSSGSTDAPQASGVTGRSFQPVLSAQDIQASSAAALNFAQAKLTNHQMGLTDANTRLVQMQGNMQEMENTIFSKYGEYEKILGLKESDARVAFTDAQTALTNINEKLSKYNLEEMLPEQVSNVISDTILKYSQSYLNDSLRFKSDQEREQAQKIFPVQVALLAATISREYATAYNQRQQGYQSGVMGSLYDGFNSPGYQSIFQDARGKDFRNQGFKIIFNKTYKSTIDAIRSNNRFVEFMGKSRTPDGSFWDSLGSFFMNVGSLSPFGSGFSYGSPTIGW